MGRRAPRNFPLSLLLWRGEICVDDYARGRVSLALKYGMGLLGTVPVIVVILLFLPKIKACGNVGLDPRPGRASSLKFGKSKYTLAGWQ